MCVCWLAAFPALATEEVVERVAVRNRLYELGNRLEISPSAAFMLQNQLVDHVALTGSVAYNFINEFAVEGRMGYAFTRHTGLANDVANQLIVRDPNSDISRTDDLAGLWEMKYFGLLGARWQPIYGKLSLFSEIPVHFQAYLWAGGGAGGLYRTSVVYCQGVTSRATGCDTYLRENKIAPLGSAALGFRFFTHPQGALRAEVRNYLFPDSYRLDVDRRVAEAGGETGANKVNGVTALWLLDLGYTFLF